MKSTIEAQRKARMLTFIASLHTERRRVERRQSPDRRTAHDFR